MARHFTAANIANGYAAMGGHRMRPIISGGNKSRGDIKAAIEAERRKAARMAAASQKKK